MIPVHLLTNINTEAATPDFYETVDICLTNNASFSYKERLQEYCGTDIIYSRNALDMFHVIQDIKGSDSSLIA
jgi:hypothetical protein